MEFIPMELLRLFGIALVAAALTAANVVPASAKGWHGRALCSKTGAIGEIFNSQNRSAASGGAVAACVRNGGIPNCCRIIKLDYHTN
jgi:hypothetical protein